MQNYKNLNPYSYNKNYSHLNYLWLIKNINKYLSKFFNKFQYLNYLLIFKKLDINFHKNFEVLFEFNMIEKMKMEVFHSNFS